MQQLDLFNQTPLPIRSERLRWKARHTKIVGIFDNEAMPLRPPPPENLRADANRWATPEAIAAYDRVVQRLAAERQLRLFVNRRWFSSRSSDERPAA